MSPSHYWRLRAQKMCVVLLIRFLRLFFFCLVLFFFLSILLSRSLCLMPPSPRCDFLYVCVHKSSLDLCCHWGPVCDVGTSMESLFLFLILSPLPYTGTPWFKLQDTRRSRVLLVASVLWVRGWHHDGFFCRGNRASDERWPRRLLAVSCD